MANSVPGVARRHPKVVAVPSLPDEVADVGGAPAGDAAVEAALAVGLGDQVVHVEAVGDVVHALGLGHGLGVGGRKGQGKAEEEGGNGALQRNE